MLLVALDLDKIFKPKSVAIVGASDEEGSVGYALVQNLTEHDFKGEVFLVNIRKKEILGRKAYARLEDVPGEVDLAIIATPAKTVPGIVEDCGKSGIKGVIIVSAGFKEVGQEGRLLEEEIKRLRGKYDLRIIGPNCLGIIRPDMGLNATFLDKYPKSGKISFISQSGALGSAILDWATHENVGFNNFVSIGSMIDVDFGDLIDYFGTDPKTKSILMYIEGIADARQFMSAARHFAKTKPIIVVKSGKFSESAKAAASHTGSLSGEDGVYDAAFKRAGIVRVDEIEDLFNAAEVLGTQPLPKGKRLAIITNAGGPGVMATDSLIINGGELSRLSSKSLTKLDEVLPSFWSKANPIDLLGDAKSDRYKVAVEACLEDDGVDGLLIIYTDQAVTESELIAETIVKTLKDKNIQDKTVITSFIGYEAVEEANRIFNANNVPTYETPEDAIKTYMYMYQYKRNLELLYETPEELPIDSSPPKRPIMNILRQAASENRETLTEDEAKRLLDYYNFPVVKTEVAKSAEEAVNLARRIGYPVVLKILSPQITHKTDVGGVVLDLTSDAQVRESFGLMTERAKKACPQAEILGVTVQSMIKREGYEVIIGGKSDPLFGPVILFGLGGVAVELFKDYAMGLPPLNTTLARKMMAETKVFQLLKGYRNQPGVNLKLLEEIMLLFSQLLIDFPQLKEIDINPLILTEKEAYILDARVIFDKANLEKEFEPHQHLVISPYPKKYELIWHLKDGREILFRPIKPEDEPLWLEMFQSFSEESIRYRFFQILKETPHEVRVRYCNIDYDREIAIVPIIKEENTAKILGVGRLTIEPDGKTGEIAFIVRDKWQGLGLGAKLVDYVIEIAAEKGIKRIVAIIMRQNHKAINLVEKMGFQLKKQDEDTVIATLQL
jgi:acetyltransferase